MITKIRLSARHLLTIFFLCGSGASAAWDFGGFDPAAMSMGGAGVALAGRTGATPNPAQLSLADTRSDVLVDMARFGRQRASSMELENSVHDFSIAAQAFAQSNSETDRLTVIGTMPALAGKSQTRHIFAGGRVAFPNLPVSLGAEVNASFVERVAPEFTGPASAYAPAASVSVARKAVATVETGALFSGVVRGNAGQDRTAIGFAPRLLSVRSYIGNAPAETANINAIPAQTRETGKLNFDFGLVQELGFDWKFGARVRNAVPYSVAAGDSGSVIFHSRPAVRVGVARRMQRWLVALDSDVNANGGFDWEERQRVVSLGGEYQTNDWLKLRVGTFLDAAANTKDNSGVSAGLGVAADYLNADIGAMLTRKGWVLAGRLGLAF